jgi:ribonuclease T1
VPGCLFVQEAADARRTGRARTPAAALVATLVALALVLVGCAGASSAVTSGASGLPVVAVADLPPQARDMLALVASGGPYPDRQDGAVFANREGLLPRRASGYYREYTVPTPGSPDRGARRLVVGGAGDVYYTADHYSSFREVLR